MTPMDPQEAVKEFADSRTADRRRILKQIDGKPKGSRTWILAVLVFLWIGVSVLVWFQDVQQQKKLDDRLKRMEDNIKLLADDLDRLRGNHNALIDALRR